MGYKLNGGKGDHCHRFYCFFTSSVTLISPDTIVGEFLDVIVYGIVSKSSLTKITEGNAIVVLCLM